MYNLGTIIVNGIRFMILKFGRLYTKILLLCCPFLQDQYSWTVYFYLIRVKLTKPEKEVFYFCFNPVPTHWTIYFGYSAPKAFDS